MNTDDIECPVARSVAERVAQRAQVGKAKYGVSMMRDDYTLEKTMEMAVEEALDFAVYLTRAIMEAKKKQQIEQEGMAGRDSNAL